MFTKARKWNHTHFYTGIPTTVFKEDKITRNRVVGIVLCGEVKRYSL